METINHECYVSLEVAKLLKQAGFDWESHFTQKQQQDEWQQSASIEVLNPYYDKTIPFSSQTNIIILPHVTLEVAQRWLREVKGYHISVFPETTYKEGIMYKFSIYKEDYDLNANHIYTGQTVKTYEEAQEAGIKKALEIILDEGK